MTKSFISDGGFEEHPDGFTAITLHADLNLNDHLQFVLNNVDIRISDKANRLR